MRFDVPLTSAVAMNIHMNLLSRWGLLRNHKYKDSFALLLFLVDIFMTHSPHVFMTFHHCEFSYLQKRIYLKNHDECNKYVTMSTQVFPLCVCLLVQKSKYEIEARRKCKYCSDSFSSCIYLKENFVFWLKFHCGLLIPGQIWFR